MQGSLEEQFAAIAAAGCYQGIEAGLPRKEEASQFRELLDRYGFQYIAMVFTGEDDHAASFEKQATAAAEFNPVLINSHSAKDSMPYDQQQPFFEHALRVERAIGIPVAHETHRGRAMFTPWTTAALLRDFPELKITADFSHWCCVCESLLADQLDNLKLAFERAYHIHARVGYAEGPQVPHPAAPEYAEELSAHEAWWQEIFKARAAAGQTEFTLTPEFGPPGYLHTLPFTNQPVANLWDVCLWMAKRAQSYLK
ncbi:sugar phosphate isomerase/epimerase [Paenibacillus cremeus]|uniref:Sugar phosphate isomerase/epimerase n=2 Tax=Paenibacillus cremeus TaxID=2163881 RepID=A0A559KBP3_9BACL|nr:sugar phosphate isomerase/epimerase [Paenibacillus cremeus]